MKLNYIATLLLFGSILYSCKKDAHCTPPDFRGVSVNNTTDTQALVIAYEKASNFSIATDSTFVAMGGSNSVPRNVNFFYEFTDPGKDYRIILLPSGTQHKVSFSVGNDGGGYGLAERTYYCSFTITVDGVATTTPLNISGANYYYIGVSI